MPFVKSRTTRIQGLTVETRTVVTVLLMLGDIQSEKAKYCREFYSEYEQHTSLMQAFSFNTAVSHLVYFTQVHYQNRIIPCYYQRDIFIGTPATNLPGEHRSTIPFTVPHLRSCFRDRSSNQQHLWQSRDKLK